MRRPIKKAEAGSPVPPVGTVPVPALPFSVAHDHVRLAVRLTPRAARNGVDGVVRGADGRPALQLRLVAPPVEGAANAALIVYLARALDIRTSCIRIVSGERSRLKIVDLSGEGPAIAARLKEWIPGSKEAGKGLS